MSNDWRKESASEAKIFAVLVGGAIGLIFAGGRYITKMVAKSTFSDQLRRVERRQQLREQTIKALLDKSL